MATKKKDGDDSTIYNINDFELGDIIEFTYPISKKTTSQTFGAGKLVKITNHRKGPKSIELRNSNGKVLIAEKNIRWDRTIYHKKNTGSKLTCQIKLKI